MVCRPFQVECIDDFNNYLGRPYKYLRKGGIFTVVQEEKSSIGNLVYVINTPRGPTHYRASCFKKLDTYQYDPNQQGDTSEDI